MNKSFLTIDEQIALLENRGMETDGDTGRILMREGYYSIVNGYKGPFIDRDRTRKTGDDRYIDGSRFSEMHELFLFDRALREITFKFLIRAEATTRTAVAYCFADAHRPWDAYLDQSCYATRVEYERRGDNDRDYLAEVSGLTSALRRVLTRSDAPFVAHYREAYGLVPLWVLANSLTFGNLEHFFNLMKDREQAAVCRMVADATGRLGDKRLGFFSPTKARVSLEVLVKFRNICAHDERLYCARVGGRKGVNYAGMARHLERFLSPTEYAAFVGEFVQLSSRSLERSEKVGSLLQELGLMELKDYLLGPMGPLASEASA